MKKVKFAQNLFDRRKMKKFLHRKTFKTISNATLLEEISDKDVENFAKGLRKWALKNGATRFSLWFQPLNNCTAGKRDSIFSVDERGCAIVKLRKKELKQGEGDASSFPSGGLRQTFEARGITSWDCTSPAFIVNDCLFIPATFRSSTGEVLDKKTPLLRSCVALNHQALRLTKLAGYNFSKVFSVVGAEQEYFLLDKQKFLQRKDFVTCNRTLFGAPPTKCQEMHNHYFSAPHSTTLHFWHEVDHRLWQLGIVAKTEHREVAPNQFELAPCYTTASVACDQNLIICQTLQQVADELGLVCILHEKPFENINGSGKHNNWSLLTDTNCNLFELGKTPQEQARFVLLFACLLQGLSEHKDLLYCSVSSPANDCRLGGFEAPPKTFSFFVGQLYNTICTALNTPDWKFGTSILLQTHICCDRNRTSPFAYTGNKFEFRMVGSSCCLADCNTVLNTVMAHALKTFADQLEQSQNFWNDAQILVQQVLQKHGNIVYNGNNYSAEWQAEAKRRNLVGPPNTAKAAECLTSTKNVQLFEEQLVLTQNELAALQQVCWRNYANTIMLESKTIAEIVFRQIVPVVQTHLKKLLQILLLKDIANADIYEMRCYKNTDTVLKKLWKETNILQKKIQLCKTIQCAKQAAHFAAEQLQTNMKQVRQLCDTLEQLCPQDIWPFPTYDQLLN